MTSRLHKLAALAAVLAAGALAPSALAYPQLAPGTGTARVSQDLRSPDARDAALHPRYLLPRTAPQPPTWPQHPQTLAPSAARHAQGAGTAGDGNGLGTAPLVGILAAVAGALAAAGLALRRRQAHTVA